MSFLDSEVPASIGEPLDGLLFTCVVCPSADRLPGAATAPVGTEALESSSASMRG
jgi:hypothetical protein